MCLAIPGEIIKLNKDTAKVSIMGVESEINIQIIEEPKVGDYVLIHAGCAIKKIDLEYFEELTEMLELLSEVEGNYE
ncbi:HypC/HybG/HupF family hydrogenase formation chaperone [Clostridium sp.]|uniref:HypC/HybG/HupF family hydrogenase formation chaperone n=1 Tax=Clostridium sp. TaxID=1506 RepID=UPI0029076FCB|nr:HypC/HybG/HupF family hydrogenase formation chaperone [Clostridium sp.]MDU5105129.1 HypC/HybG/HupF family hydrogenase formation chaperone [Clostridium sp.]